MADPSNDEKFDKGIEKQTIGGQQSHRSEYGRQGGQTEGREADEIREETSGGTGGQPIGGNDSGTGSGTPLTQGYGGAGGTSSTSGAGVGTPGGQTAETGGQAATGQAQPGSGAAPPRSMGTRGTEFGQMSDYDRSGQQGQSGTGQADLGSQAGSTLAGRTDQQELGEQEGEVDQPGSYAGGLSGRQAEPIQGEGFIARPSTDTDELLQETESQDFAPGGQGAVETDTERNEKNDSNIEGGIG